jgi:DNA-binding MarR family transcriptional regulator
VSSDFLSDFGSKDPIRALFLSHQAGEGLSRIASRGKEGGGDSEGSVEELDRQKLVKVLDQEMRAQSAWTLLFHHAVAEHLKLNVTDHKCLDMIWRCHETTPGECMTPGQLARETKLTTGAVTGVLDRLEQAGYVSREHDPEDRRRIIVRPIPERIKADVWPLFDWVAGEFTKLCARYSEEELRRMIEFCRESQSILRTAVDHVREISD